jgi:hypothetical protein
MGRREGERVVRVGHAEMREVQLPEGVVGDPRATADVIYRSWPWYQRLLFRRRAKSSLLRMIEQADTSD